MEDRRRKEKAPGSGKKKAARAAADAAGKYARCAAGNDETKCGVNHKTDRETRNTTKRTVSKAANSAMRRAAVKKGDKTVGKKADKMLDKAADKIYGKSGDKKFGRATDKTFGKSGDKISGKSGNKMSGKLGDKMAGKSVDKITGKAVDKMSDKLGGKMSGRAVDRMLGKMADRRDGKFSGKAAVKPADKKRDLGTEKSQNARPERLVNKKSKSRCPVFKECGGCQYLDMPYEDQLKMKQAELQKLLGKFCKVYTIQGMENPDHYRNKVHAVFGHRKGEPVSGVYKAGTHILVPVESCLIEDEKADEIIGTIRGMLKSFKIRTFDEDTGYGLLRHVLIRRAFATGEIMVVLVTASPVFPSKNNFVKALRQKHPEITTIVQNINGRGTSMVLGDKEHVLYGRGYIEDVLCGCRFRISSKSFYQVNPVQTELLYAKAIELAGLTGNETVIDAYCGIGTIGIVASRHAKQVIGVELNKDAVSDAVENAKCNGVKNVEFYCNDAGRFMVGMAQEGGTADVVFMDPPRSGSTEEFMRAVAAVKPKKVVYISCGPETLARDLEFFERIGYKALGAWGYDLFPATKHTECCVKLEQIEK